ncbi:MAG: hypothetical protein ABJE66_35285 [Deltaproteobacteria bacterium]
MRWSVVWFGVAAARIAHAGVDLAWHAPAACPDQVALRTAIVQRLDTAPDQIDLAVTVDVVATAEGFVAHLALGDEKRELTSTSCAELADAIAVVVARAGADAHVTAPEVIPAAPAVVAPVAAQVAAQVGDAPVGRSVAAIPRPRTSPWNAAVRVAALAGTGVSPDLDIAGELAMWASYRDFGVELAGSRWAATTAEVGTLSGVEVGLSAVALRATWSPTEHVRGWIVGELGSQRGMGVGFTDASAGSGRWSAVGAGAGFGWPIAPHLTAVVAGELEVAIERTAFALAGSDGSASTVYEAPRFAPKARLGLELSWR